MNEIQFVLYSLPDDEGKVQVVIKDETMWATQKAMAQLFGCSTDNIGLHLKNIFSSGELQRELVTEKISATASDGKYALLPDKGTISREEADRKAEEEYQLFNPTQHIDSDFDKHIRGLFDE